jgi:hypothetical protein
VPELTALLDLGANATLYAGAVATGEAVETF